MIEDNLQEDIDNSPEELFDAFYPEDDYDSYSADELKEIRRQEQHKSEVERYQSDTGIRKILAYSTQGIILLWICGVFYVLNHNATHLHLSDSVLITFLGTSTATVLGLAHIVLRGFFKIMNQDVWNKKQKDS